MKLNNNEKTGKRSISVFLLMQMLPFTLLAIAGCGEDKNSQNNQGLSYEESDFSALVGTWSDPKRDRRFSIYENGHFFEDGLRMVDEVTQVQKNYFRIRPKKSKRYLLLFLHNDKVLIVVGSHFDRDLNMDLSGNRKLTKSQIYKQHDQLVQAAIEIENGNLDVEDNANGFPLFEEIALRISKEPQHDYQKAKSEIENREASRRSIEE